MHLRRAHLWIALAVSLAASPPGRAQSALPREPAPDVSAPLSLRPPWPFDEPDSPPASPPDAAGCAGDAAGEARSWRARAGEFFGTEADKTAHTILSDFENMYLSWRLAALGGGVAVAAPLANTDADQHFQDWYRRRAHSGGSDEFARYANTFGAHWLVVPFLVGGDVLGRIYEGTAAGDTLFDWGNRSWRALLVGSPAVGALQAGLGASRPEEHSSRWRPLEDKNAVAGHGFVGAVPFLTAAAMARERNRPLVRWTCVAGSFLTTWSRVHNDDHYLSQALLGWWIAYLAVDSVSQTNCERRWHFTPVEYPNGVGGGIVFRY